MKMVGLQIVEVKFYKKIVQVNQQNKIYYLFCKKESYVYQLLLQYRYWKSFVGS